MTITGRFIENDREYPAEITVGDDGSMRGVRWARVLTTSDEDPLDWDGLPPRFTPWSEARPGLLARGYTTFREGGDYHRVRVTYSSVATQQTSSPGPIPGLLYTAYDAESGTVSVSRDAFGAKLRGGPVTAVARFPQPVVVHHRTSPLAVPVILGLIGPERTGVLGILNDRAVTMPPEEWDRAAQAPPTTFEKGQLLYIDTQPEYTGNGLWIYRHSFHAAPTFDDFWYDEDNNDAEERRVIYPEANIALLWEA